MTNLEQFEDRGRNAIQMALAGELFRDSGLNADEALLNWVNQGYAEKFDKYLNEHPEMEEKLFIDGDNEAYIALKKEILYH